MESGGGCWMVVGAVWGGRPWELVEVMAGLCWLAGQGGQTVGAGEAIAAGLLPLKPGASVALAVGFLPPPLLLLPSY